MAASRGGLPRANLKDMMMNDKLHPDILEATRLTQAGRLGEAMALLQRALHGGAAPDATGPAPGMTADAIRRPGLPIIDLVPEMVEVSRSQPPLPEALRNFLEQIDQGYAGRTGPTGIGTPFPPPAPEPLPEGARFVAGVYGDEAGKRAYKLYIPSTYKGEPLPLIVMLHGCTQTPDDFAAGTGMNRLAEEHACLVLYPAQTRSANQSRCWNWFNPADQQRDQGEPALIAGMTRQVMRDHAVDPRRVYVAGLSAGGAAAAIMGAAYPDLYAAVGVHSGLACGAASDLPSALAAMQHGAADTGRPQDIVSSRGMVPAIVFHGDRDSTVHPRNGDQVVAQLQARLGKDLRRRVEQGSVPGGHAYSRTLYADAENRVLLEQWTIYGAGHAWSGGSPAGSYTDPQGPDAAREMLRFFLDHPHPEG